MTSSHVPSFLGFPQLKCKCKSLMSRSEVTVEERKQDRKKTGHSSYSTPSLVNPVFMDHALYVPVGNIHFILQHARQMLQHSIQICAFIL